MTAMYLALMNHYPYSVTVLGVEADWASTVTLHQTIRENGVSRMEPLGPQVIAPGQSLRFEPGAKHVMASGVAPPLIMGDCKTIRVRYRLSAAVESDSVVGDGERLLTVFAPELKAEVLSPHIH